MADKKNDELPIPIESDSVFNPNLKRNIAVKKALQTAIDTAGSQAVNDVVSENLRTLRNQLNVEAGKKDLKTTEDSMKTMLKASDTNVTKKPWWKFW